MQPRTSINGCDIHNISTDAVRFETRQTSLCHFCFICCTIQCLIVMVTCYLTCCIIQCLIVMVTHDFCLTCCTNQCSIITVTHFLFTLTHLVAASLAVATLPAWNNLLCYCMVPDLKTILLSSTWNGTGAGVLIIQLFHTSMCQWWSVCDTKLVLFLELGLACCNQEPCVPQLQLINYTHS